MANAITKRVALVAAAALTLGLISAAPASAAANAVIVFSAGDGAASADLNAGNAVAGSANTATVTLKAATVGERLVRVSGAGATIASASVAGEATISADKSFVVLADGSADNILTINTPTVGTVTVTSFKRATGSTTIWSTTVEETVTITVNATAQSGVLSVANSTSYVTDAYAASPTADETVLVSATSGDAFILVSLNDALKADKQETVTVSVAGPGTLTYDNDGTYNGTVTTAGGRSFSAATHTDGTISIKLAGDNTAGTATVTIAVGTTTIATETVKFYGKTAALAVTAVEPHLVGDGVATDKAVKVVATDALGNLVPGDVLTFTGDGTIFTGALDATYSGGTDSKGEAYFDVTAADTKTGAATVTIKSADGTVSKTVSLTATGKEIASLVLTSNKASYSAGEKITLTLTAKDANGVLFGAKAITGLFAAKMAASSALTTDSFTENVTFSAGVATVDVYAPLAAGVLTFSAKTGTSLANVVAAEEGVTKSLTVTISGSADVAQIKADLAALQKSTSDLIAALSAQVSYLRKQLNQLLRRR